MYNQAIQIENSSPRITNSVIRDSTWWGIYIKSGAPEIDHNTILGSGESGLIYSQEGGHPGTINIHDNLLEENGGSAALYVGGGEETSAVSLGGNTLKKNHALEALYFNGGESGEVPPDICNNYMTENKGEHINLSGTLKKSATCGPNGYPIYPVGLTVAAGVTLTLEPGTLFRGGKVTVNGTLKAEGTTEDPVQFKPDGPGTWNGLIFNSGSGASVLEHVEVVRGGPYWGAAVTINDASPTITHSTIKSSAYNGIFIKKGGAPEISYNHIENSVSSAVFYGEVEGYSGEIDIHDNVLERNGGSAALYIGTGANISAGTLGGNTLRENSSSDAIYFGGGEVPTDLTDNKLVDNERNNIDVSGTVEGSGSWSDPGGPIDVGNLTIASGATLAVQPGVAFEGGEFIVKGTLNAVGTEDEPVLFDPHGSGQWTGLTFESGSSASLLEYVEVVRGGSFSSGRAITIKGASPTIKNSTIRESGTYGIYVPSGSPTIEDNRFRENPYALVYEGEGKLPAPNNDWGCKGGPGSSGCDAVWNVEWKPATTLPELRQPCVAGSKQPGPGLDCLLFRYAPELRYDDQESYLANSAAEITDNWGDETELWGEGGGGPYSNKLVSFRIGEFGPEEPDLAYSRRGAGGKFHLTLDSLGETYPDSEEAATGDFLDETGEDYAEDDHKLVARGYLNRSYGRVVEGAGGKVWLQYWYFYYYNSFNVEGFGLHEGDWEEIQIGLDEELEPEVLILSEHKGGASCDLGEFDYDASGKWPIVYVALDSHANYPKPGEYEDPLPLTLEAFDHANGHGPAIRPSVEVIDGEPPSWLEWPGHWGNSRGGEPGEEASPVGPLQHPEWDPDTFAEGVHGCMDTYEGPDEWGERSGRAASSIVAAPAVASMDFEGRHPAVSYKLPDGGRKESGSRLILSVKEKGSPLPPLTKVVTRTKAEGDATLPFKVDPDREVVVLASVIDRHGHRSRVVRHVMDGE
jgi:hypothetical protein